MEIFNVKEITTADGYKLSSRIFQPKDHVLGTVLIVPAIGASQDYYKSFATWLAQQGFLTATFDYRGMGSSRVGSLRGFQATLFDWAKLDCAAMIDAITALAPDKPLYWIGHSLGGQILAFVPNREKINKVIMVAAGSGYWLENAPPLKRRVWWLWFFVEPVTVSLFGYFPGKRLGMVGDLPKGVIQQWRKWCLNSDYAAGAEGSAARELYADVKTPILSLSFADDEFMSARSIEALNSFYMNSPKTIKCIHPTDIEVPRIGHFGFFKTQFEDLLWKHYLLPFLQI